MKTTNMISIIFLFLFLSCNKKNDLEIILLNKNLVSVDSINEYKIYNTSKEFKDLYFEKSLNVINFKIKNNSNKKYVLIVNKNYLDDYDYNNCSTGIEIFNNSEKKKPFISDAFDISLNDKYINYRFVKDSINFEEVDIMYNNEKKEYKTYINFYKLNVLKIKNEYVVIYPNETKYFKTFTNLPITNYRYSNVVPLNYNLKSSIHYYGRVTIKNDKKYVLLNLPTELKNEIKENGYTVFDGVLSSNKVPIQMIKLPPR
jgi:hypothetical protein